MKRFLTILLITITLCANAQHLKFMGIPLNVTIDDFEARIINKGMCSDSIMNILGKEGDFRVYNGLFCGHDVSIRANYLHDNKLVCFTTVELKSKNLVYIEQVFNEFKVMLKEKYPNSSISYDTYNGFNACVLSVFSIPTNKKKSRIKIGDISMFMDKYQWGDETYYFLKLNYIDNINYKKYRLTKFNDL